MKYYAQISSVLLFLSSLLVGYLAVETGILGYTDVAAGEAPDTRTQEDIEVQLKRRERNLNEKEIILKEQMTRYEKLIIELRTKLEAKEKEFTATISDKDRATQMKVSELEKQVKELKDSKEREVKAAKDSKEAEVKNIKETKDKEIQKLRAQIEGQNDQKRQAYRAIYEKMDAKKAAKIFDEMDIALATSIMETLKQDRAAEILSKMNVERARKITERSLVKRGTASFEPKAKEVAPKISDPVDPNANTPLENIPKGGE